MEIVVLIHQSIKHPHHDVNLINSSPSTLTHGSASHGSSAKKEWLEPFREHAELETQDDEASFEPAVPRRTALNRLREGG